MTDSVKQKTAHDAAGAELNQKENLERNAQSASALSSSDGSVNSSNTSCASAVESEPPSSKASSAAATSTASSSDDVDRVFTDADKSNNQYFPLILSDLRNQQSTSFWRGYARFWPFLKPYWVLALFGILLTIPVGALDAVIALYLKPFTDNVMVAENAEFAYRVPLVVVGFTIVQGIFLYVSALVNSYVGGAINLLMRSKLYEKLLSFDTRFFDSNNSGSVIQRFFNDTEQASNGLISNLKIFLTKFFSSVSLVCVMLYNSWELTLYAVAIVSILVFPMKIVRKRMKSLVQRQVSASTGLITLYNETTLGSRVIKSFNLKQFMYRSFIKQAEFIFKTNMKMARDTNWLAPIMHLVGSIGVALVLYLGVDKIVSGEMTSGAFVSFLAALIMLYTPLKNIGNNYIQVQGALLALDRMYDLLDYDSFESGKNEGKQELKDIKQDIEFKHVYFSYTGLNDVLKDINFKAHVGQKIALVGNSGGGKTTVCSLITRLYEIRSGQILIDGVDIHDYTLESLRHQVAFVFQDNFLFEGTVRQNILFGKEDATEEEIQKALKGAYLEEFVAGLPQGLDTQIGERGVILSGGQRQRLAIARAMIRNAPLVILDEATSALDNRSEKVVQKALDELMKGRTTLVIAHRLSTVQDADNILVINDGHIVEQGNHEQLLALNGAYAALYNSQFKTTSDEASTESAENPDSAHQDKTADNTDVV